MKNLITTKIKKAHKLKQLLCKHKYFNAYKADEYRNLSNRMFLKVYAICPYCGKIKKTSSEKAGKMHIFTELKKYIVVLVRGL